MQPHVLSCFNIYLLASCYVMYLVCNMHVYILHVMQVCMGLIFYTLSVSRESGKF